MWIVIVRIVLLLLFLAVAWLLFKRRKMFKKKIVVVLAILFLVGLWWALAIFPIENFFITFKSPQSAFYYTQMGQIEGILYGNDSCMIITKGSYSFVLKSAYGYKITNPFSVRHISHFFARDFDVYNISGTNDYYVVGSAISKDDSVNIYNNSGELVGVFKTYEANSPFYFAYVNGFSKDDYALINGEKVFMTKQP